MLLVALVVLIGVFPGTFAGPLVTTAAKAVVGARSGATTLRCGHGVTGARISVFAFAGGGILLWRYADARGCGCRAAAQAKPAFDAAVAAVTEFCRAVTDGLHDGSLRLTSAGSSQARSSSGSAASSRGTRPGRGRRSPPPGRDRRVRARRLLRRVLAFERRRMLALVMLGVVGLIVAFGFLYSPRRTSR